MMYVTEQQAESLQQAGYPQIQDARDAGTPAKPSTYELMDFLKEPLKPFIVAYSVDGLWMCGKAGKEPGEVTDCVYPSENLTKALYEAAMWVLKNKK